MKNVLSLISGFLFLIGYVPYIRAIVKRETQPSKASWLIWLTIDIVTVTAMVLKHALNAQMVGASLGSAITFILVLKYGVPGWSRMDKTCLAGAVVGILLSIMLREPNVGIIVSMIVVVIGSVPTYQNAWRNPKAEDKTAWTIFFISSVLASLAIPRWTIEDAAQPLTYFGGELVVIYLLYVRPAFQRPRPLSA